MPDQDGMVPEQFPLTEEIIDRKFYRHRSVERAGVVGFTPPLTLGEWKEIEAYFAEDQPDE